MDVVKALSRIGRTCGDRISPGKAPVDHKIAAYMIIKALLITCSNRVYALPIQSVGEFAGSRSQIRLCLNKV